MESFSLLLEGFVIAFTWQNILFVLLGTFLGTVIGMLPGIGPVNAIAVLFPIVYSLGVPPATVLILFAGVYYGAQYGNSISSILLNVPGTSASAVTAIDGYALAKKGFGGKALAMSAVASFVGGTISIFFLALFAPLLAKLAINFGPAEYTVLMVFAFVALSSFSLGSLAKAIISAFLGLAIATIGIDSTTGVSRLTFGMLELYDGIDFIVVVIGFFAVSELLYILMEDQKIKTPIQSVTSLMISIKEITASIVSILRSCVSGFLVGVLPGAGGTIASFIAYATEKKLLTDKNEFGKGDLRGVAAPESANNSASVGAFIPLLILGVPGSETTAVMLGGLISFGIKPGPLLLENNPEIFWGLAASMFIGNFFLIILNLPLVGLFARILQTPRWILMPMIMMLCIVGAYTINGSEFDVILIMIFGLVGYIMRRAEFPLAPLVLGVVLGGLIETNFRRAMIYSHGSVSIFFDSAICITLWFMAVASLLVPSIMKKVKIK
ncbi:MAG: tripartite tricarboxylate transporter permease [SAR324 cluster bacterium]|nr:tripartite tricarboxylate transporter permease [SAR324 cluster bacterium]